MDGNPKSSTMLTAALVIAAKGTPVFPCHPADPPGTPKARRNAKKPLIAGGFKAATTDAEQITRWWTDWPLALIGMPTGAITGLVVLDIDKHQDRDGFTALTVLEAEHGALPETLTIITASGGEHRYFKLPEGADIRNSTSKLGDGLDIRAIGGYVIVPPSPGYSVKQRLAVADMPEWLIEALRKRERKPPPGPRQSLQGPYTHAQYLSALRAIPPNESEAAWFETLCGAHDAGLTEAECRQWSKGSPEQYSDAKFTAHWNSIAPDLGITAGTLIYKARAAGWDDPYFISADQLKGSMEKILTGAKQ